MLEIIYAITPIVLALLAGFLVGKTASEKLPSLAAKVIGPLVWLLLLTIGMKFGNILKDPAIAGRTVVLASIFSLLTTAVSCLLIFMYFKLQHDSSINTEEKRTGNFMAPVKDCAISLLLVFGGAFTASSTSMLEFMSDSTVVVDTLLYLLIFAVGVDMVGLKLSSQWRSTKIIIVPVLVVLGSLLGGGIASLIVSEQLDTSLALSSGFGWFTLSGVMVSSKLGPIYGAVALMTDLFRELLAIILLYLFGHKYSRECIGAGGATTMDSTLPVIKQTCHVDYIPIALLSGLLLSLAAPILITFFLSLS